MNMQITSIRRKRYRSEWIMKRRKIVSLVLAFCICFGLFSGVTPRVSAAEGWLWPVSASKTISSNFGMRDLNENMADGYEDFHAGIDISCPVGTAVRATKSGTVYDCCFSFGTEEKIWTNDMRSYGNYVAIKHSDGTYSLYAHLKQQQIVSKGASVSQGQTIAYSGNSGSSGGPHCHFQATKNPSSGWSNKGNLINTMPTPSCISANGITVRNPYVEASGCSATRMTYVFDSTPSYYLDVNGLLDGSNSGNTDNYGTFDVYIDGVQKANDVTDYYVQWPSGTKYEIKDIKAIGGHVYTGVVEGSLSGTIGSSKVNIRLSFSTSSSSSSATISSNKSMVELDLASIL